MNFENLMQRARDVVQVNPGLNYEAVMMRLFLEGLKHYKKIAK
jgi:hypothetical protein